MFHEKAILPKGYSCASINCGLKKDGAEDLSVIYSEKSASAAAVFTKNQVPGAPVIVGREIIKKGKLQALVINSKVSNVGTGEQGVANARRMGQAVSKEFDCSADEVLMSSTGVIAVQLPIEKVEAGVVGIREKMQIDPLIAAKGIMTTDTQPKIAMEKCFIGNSEIKIFGVAKGSGMIQPNMATTLGYLFTDANIPNIILKKLLKKNIETTFNAISCDSDTSTNDMVSIFSTGKANHSKINNINDVKIKELDEAINKVLLNLAKRVVADGEGASKFITINLNNCKTEIDAKKIAFSIANSPLVKTAIAGEDPNWGRIIMAIGKAGVSFNIDKLSIRLGDINIIQNGKLNINYNEDETSTYMRNHDIEINVSIVKK